jgi:glycosyltransferase involved in cell wall biosynthesis
MRILHCHSTFDLGGKEARDVDLMNAWGAGVEHVILSSVPGALGARALIASEVCAHFPEVGPPLAGAPSPLRLRAIAQWIGQGGFDLVLTFNFGALDALLARRLFGGPPIVHHEDGFNEDELAGQKSARRWLRRLALPAAHMLVVPSRNLERIAAATWKRVATYIPNGIDMVRFDEAPASDAIPGFERRAGEVVVGTLAGLRPVKNLPRLVRAFASATRQAPGVPARLVIVGRGPDEARIRAEAERWGISDRLVMPGFLAHPHRYVGLFDIFALSSDSEQFPISLVEAMAAGLPVVSTRVGDVAEIVAKSNTPFLADTSDEDALAWAMARLISDPGLRARVGADNRSKVAVQYTRAAMIARYERVYSAALGRPLLDRNAARA